MLRELTEQLQKDLGIEHLEVVLLNSGISRSVERYRNVALFFEQGQGRCVARWYGAESGILSQEAEILRELENCTVTAPRCLGLYQFAGKNILVESFVAGDNLQFLFDRSMLSLRQCTKLADAAFAELHKRTAQPSTETLLRQELDELFSFTSRHLILHDEQEQICVQLEERLFAAMRDQSIHTSLVHNDFRLKNLVVQNNQVSCFDFEFTRRSHLKFLDWLRLWEYSRGLSRGRMLEFDVPESLASLFARNDLLQAMFAAFELQQLQVKLLVYPPHLRARSIRDSRAKLERVLSTESFSAYLQEVLPEDLEQEIPDNEFDYFEARYREELEENLQLRNESQRHRARFENAQNSNSRLLEHNRELLAEIEQLRAALQEAQTSISNEGRITDLENILAHRDMVLNDVVNSLSFRIGSRITGVMKKIPGATSLKQ